MNRLLSTTLVSVCLAATTASVAIAQTAPNPNPPSAADHTHKFSERPFSRPTERVEAKLAYVRAALKISDAQQAQWDAYAAQVRKIAQDMEQGLKSRQHGEAGHPGHPAHQRPTSIERLERAQAFHTKALTRLNQLLAVQKPLYAALSPEQQKVADVVLNRRGRSMDRSSMHGRGGFGRG